MNKKEFLKYNPDVEFIDIKTINGKKYIPLDDLTFYDCYYVDDMENVKQLTILQVDKFACEYIKENRLLNEKSIDMDLIENDLWNYGLNSCFDVVMKIQELLKKENENIKLINEF